MHIVAIRPRSPARLGTYSEGLRWWGCRAFVAPRLPALLAAIADRHQSVSRFSILDLEAGDAADFDGDADYALIIAESRHIPSIRYLCGRFRARKVHTLLAGSYVSALPQRADFVDTRLIGEVESAFEAFLSALDEGRPIPAEISAPTPVDPARLPLPKWETLDLSSYLFGEIEVSRGSDHGPGGWRRMSDERIPAEIDALRAAGAGRIRLETPGLWSKEAEARSLLELLSRRDKRHPQLSCTGGEELLNAGPPRLFAAAGIRRIELIVDPREGGIDSARLHRLRAPLQALNAEGIHAVLHVAWPGKGLDEETMALLTELPATPLMESEWAEPGTPRYEALEAEGRLLRGGRDAALRRDPLDAPNFTSADWDRREVKDALRAAARRLYAPEVIATRIRPLARGDRLPLPELRALIRMLAEAPRHRDEKRIELTLRALLSLLKTRTSPLRWDRALDAFLENAANRSLIERVVAGRELEHAVTPKTLKQTMLGLVAKAAARAA